MGFAITLKARIIAACQRPRTRENSFFRISCAKRLINNQKSASGELNDYPRNQFRYPKN